MVNYGEKIIEDIELHSVAGIKECFANGVDPNAVHKGEPLIYELTSEYMRSDNFKHCVRAFVDGGLEFDDKLLLAVLLDDANTLESMVKADPAAIQRPYTLRSAFTPLEEVSLLHICAEFNHVACARVLVSEGADIDRRAGTDQHGFGGQTPVFHTVNQILNHSFEMLQFLLDRSCNLQLTVKGLIWGKGYDWETFIPAVNPISYAMMGLLPQLHRNEMIIGKVVSILMKKAYGIDYHPSNLPNQYLKK